MSSIELENHDNHNSSEQHTEENGSDNHALLTTIPGVQNNSSVDNLSGTPLQNNFLNSSKLGDNDNHSSSSEQHTQEGQTDSDGYEYHYTSATNHEAHANELHDSVVRGSSSDDLLYGGGRNDVLDGSDGNDRLEGSDGDDILIGGGNTDKGENHLNGGIGDDILVAGGSKTSQLNQLLAHRQDITGTLLTDQKWGSVASIANGVADNTGGGAHNIFDVHSGNGHDQIFNFHAGTDKVQIDRGLNGSNIRDMETLLQHTHISGNDVSIDLGGGNTLTLVGVDTAGLNANNLAWI